MKNLFRLRLTLILAACAAVILLAPVAALAEEPAKPAPPAKQENKEAATTPAEPKAAEKAKTDADACKSENTGYFNTLEDFFAYGPALPTAEIAAAEPAAIEWTETAAEAADATPASKPEPKQSESD